MTTIRRLSFGALCASLLLGPVLAVAAPSKGPPGLCHPLDIGAERSLPFGSGAFEVDPAFDRSRTVDETEGILAGTDNVLVHMETLRRAVVYLTHGKEGGSQRANDIERLVAVLQARLARANEPAVGAEGSPSSRERATCLAELDLGYALGLLAEVGRSPLAADRSSALLDQAVTRFPEDGALRLAAAIVHFSRGDAEGSCQHLRVVLAQEQDDLLQRNACRTMGACFGAKSRGELSAVVEATLQGA